MKIQLGILACLLAGCATQSTESTAPDTASLAAELDLALARTEHADLRVGLEFLPPDNRLPGQAAVRVEAVQPRARSQPAAMPDIGPEWDLARDGFPMSESKRSSSLSDIDFESIDNPIVRETLHFYNDLIDTDRQRVATELGVPFFDFQDQNHVHGQLLTSDQRLLDEREQWCQEFGPQMLNRPLKLLGRRLPFVKEIELAVQDFRSRHVPLSKPYQRAHGGKSRERLSLRMHAREIKDPLEVVYIYHGVRMGTSRLHGKLSFDFQLAERVFVSIRGNTAYQTGDSRLRADLIYQASPRMSVRVTAGDNMDFISTSSLYSLFESPMDGRAGILFYAVHTF